MNQKGNLFRRLLYKYLPLEAYLNVLSKMYFLSFNLGLLKGNRYYDYPIFLNKIVKQGDVCIDIGANLGYLTVVLSKLAGVKGKVYAVEPVKPVLSALKKNTKHLKNVEVLPFALGDDNKLIQLGNNSIKNSGYLGSGSHFVLEKDADAEIVFEAEMRKGSELFGHLNKIDFVKCDIEGYEMVVIPEMEQIINKFKPILLIESLKEKRKQMLAFFKERNYNGYILNNKEILYPAKEDEHWDMFFIHNDKMKVVEKYLTDTNSDKI